MPDFQSSVIVEDAVYDISCVWKQIKEEAVYKVGGNCSFWLCLRNSQKTVILKTSFPVLQLGLLLR